MRRKRTEEEIEEARVVGRALQALRVSRGLAQKDIAAKAGLGGSALSKIEMGSSYPRRATIRRILAALGVTVSALQRAEELVRDPAGEGGEEPIDTPPLNTEESRRAAVTLAQEVGRAVAHCCLAFMELQAGGWRPRNPKGCNRGIIA